MSPSERENRKRRAAPVRSANGRREPARPERPLPKRGKPAWVRPEYRRRARLRNKLIAGLLAVAVVLVVLLLANSTVLRSNGAVVLARRELPSVPVFFCQTDAAWADAPMGASGRTLGEAGDGLTCLAALIEMQQLKTPIEGEVNPGTLNAWLSENGAYDATGSLNWQRAAALLGVSLTERQPGWGIAGTLEMLIQQEVYPVVRVKQPGTGTLHDVLLVGTVHGEFQIMDPLDSSGEPNSLSVYGNRIYDVRYLK